MDIITEERIEEYYLYGLSSSNTPNKIRYIGYTKTPNKRLNEHLKDCNRRGVNTHKKSWIRKELKNGYTIIMTIIGTFENHQSVILAEIKTIQVFKDMGYNLVNGTLGGDGLVATEFVKQKISKANLGKKQPLAAIEKTRLANLGRKHSEETKRKMSDSRRGKCGRVWTKEERERASKSRKGKKSPLIGRRISQDVKNKISASKTGVPTKKRKPVQQFNKENKLINTFSSLTEAINISGVNNIYRCIIGDRKTAGGYIWRYQ